MFSNFKNISVVWKIGVLMCVGGIVFSVVHLKPSIPDHVDAAIEQGEKRAQFEKALEAGIKEHLEENLVNGKLK